MRGAVANSGGANDKNGVMIAMDVFQNPSFQLYHDSFSSRDRPSLPIVLDQVKWLIALFRDDAKHHGGHVVAVSDMYVYGS